MSKPKHILVIRLSAIGDVAMSVPVLRSFVSQNPDVKITVLSRAFLKPLFDGISNVNFYAADLKGIHKGIFGLKKLSNELLNLKIDAIADIHNVLRSKILRLFLSFSNIKIVVIDKGRAEKKALTRIQNKIFKQLRSTHERYADVFRELGFEVDLSKYQYPEKKVVSSKTKSIIGNSDKIMIGIAPFTQYKSKMYPLDLMEVIISELSQNSNYQIIFFGGGQKEIEILNSYEDKYKNTISFVEKFNFDEELVLISNLDCMLSMDSANAHLAAMEGVKTITLWGITHPYAGFYPFQQPMEYALIPDLQKYPNIPCSIYGNKVCNGYEDVMQTINPYEVIKKIEEVIKSPKK
ncbi:MAG: glycosyltransferase family 9 protein [Bacteroidota bacterium]